MSIMLLLVMAAACKKTTKVIPEAQSPYAMQYTDLKDTSIRMSRAAAFDLNNDGEWDIFFGTMLVGDPVRQEDKHQWLVYSSFNSNLPVSSVETIPVLRSGDVIPAGDFPGYKWYNGSAVCLVQKVVGFVLPPVWEGDWKNANRQYIPLQVKKSGALYNGWVEVSFNTAAEKLVLHKAAVCMETGKLVLAGK